MTESPRVLVAARDANTSERKALAAGRDDDRLMFVSPKSAAAPHVCDLGISTVSDAGVHHPTAIVVVNVVGQHLRIASQSRAAKHALKRSYTWLAAFSSRGAGRLS